MSNVKIEFSGEPSEMAEMIRQFMVSFASSDVMIAPIPSENLVDKWTIDDFMIVWSELKDGAKEVLMQIAENSGKISNTDLQEVLHLENGFQIAGRMSSFGSAIKRVGFSNREPFYSYDYVNGIYNMKPDYCEMVQKIIGNNADESK